MLAVRETDAKSPPRARPHSARWQKVRRRVRAVYAVPVNAEVLLCDPPLNLRLHAFLHMKIGIQSSLIARAMAIGARATCSPSSADAPALAFFAVDLAPPSPSAWLPLAAPHRSARTRRRPAARCRGTPANGAAAATGRGRPCTRVREQASADACHATHLPTRRLLRPTLADPE